MELSLADLRQLISGCEKRTAYKVGEKYLIRCVTLYYTGRITDITDEEIVLEDAAWIADTGRFSDALKTGKLDEVEPFAFPVIIPRSSVVDASVWPHDLPREQV